MTIPLFLLALGQANGAAVPPAVPPAVLPLVPVCLTRTVTDADGGSHPFPIVVRQGSLDAETLARFGPVACVAAGIEAVRYRTEVCRLAGLGNAAVQARLEYVIGAPPRVLCADATAFGASLATILTQGN